MRHYRVFFSVLGYLVIHVGLVEAQTKLSAEAPIKVTLNAGQKQALEISAQPGSLGLFQLQMEGGLIAVQSTEAPRRVLDLGRGGQLLYAVVVSPEGIARIELSSAEQSRPATVIIQDATNAHTEQERQHLHDAGIAFARADSTRRHQPGAPDEEAALLLYDSAITEAQAAHDISLARWAMTQKARFLIFQKSSFVETLSLLNSAAALPDDNDEATQALTYKTLSSDEYFVGDLQASVDTANRALSLYRKTGDVYWQGIVLGNLISFYGEEGREEDAIAAGKEALADSEQAQDPAGVVFSLTELATLYREQGKYELAFQTFRKAIAWGESIHYAPLVEAEIEKDLGLFYLDLGLWEEAEEQFHLCLRHAAPEGQAALDVRGMLARVLEQRGDSQGALREYGAAIAIAEKLHLQPEEVTLLLRRSSTLLHTGPKASAQRDVIKAAQLSDALNIASLRVDSALAEGALQEHTCASCSEAKQAYERALALARETGEREQEAAAGAGLAHVYKAQQNYIAALHSIEEALVIAEHSRASLASQDLAASYFTERHNWYDLAIETSMQLDHLSPGTGYSEISFRYVERSRSRAMLDAIGEDGWQAPSDLPPNLRQRILVNDHQIEKEKSLLLTSTEPKKIAASLKSLYLEEDALAAETESQPGQLPRGSSDRVASAKDVQQSLLHPGDALLAFSQGPTHTFRWLVTSTSVSVATLPAKQRLQLRLSPLRQMLVERKPALHPGEDVEQYRSRLEEWDKARDDALLQAGQLLVPTLPSTIHHLYIVAEGSLLSLPWSALRFRCGQRTCYAVERYAISTEPSASVAVSLARRPPESKKHGVLLVADTIVARDLPTLRWTALTPLPGSRREADSIARLVPANSLRQLRGDQATVENVRSFVQGNLSILHFSTHTILVSGHPELSGIALSSSGPTGGEGQSVLWLRDIPSLHAPPLVTLSGCTTQGKNLSGEELTTLTQAFFYAGAQQVIGSIWSVDDEATATLMDGFYRRLLTQKMGVPEAMRQAQLSMLHDQAALPDWAGFVVNGVQPVADGLLPGRK
jgi:CHAT domain-containing protein